MKQKEFKWESISEMGDEDNYIYTYRAKVPSGWAFLVTLGQEGEKTSHLKIITDKGHTWDK